MININYRMFFFIYPELFRFLILSQFEYPCQMMYLGEWRWFGNFIVQQYSNKNSFV